MGSDQISVRAADIAAMQQMVQQDLEQAMPALQDAVRDVQLLNKRDICEVRTLISPPALVKLALQALCIMFEIPPCKISDPSVPGRKIDDYWQASRRTINEPPGILQRMLNYEKDSIPEKIIRKLEPI